MKLTKSKLIKLTELGLKELGYKEVKDTITGAQGLYIKKVKVGFYLTLGLTISRYYDSLFTASFYLSKTTIWSAVWGDISKNSYQRIGHFLTTEDRGRLLNKEYSLENVRDAWWDINDNSAIVYFLESVQIAEERFLDQPNLFYDIERSEEINRLSRLATSVIKKMDLNEITKYEYQFVPEKPIDGIPLEWFKLAERVIVEESGILNYNTVKRLAADAYRQKLI